jgi:hypothetical protein
VAASLDGNLAEARLVSLRPNQHQRSHKPSS